MKIVKKSQTVIHKNNDFCTATEYPNSDKDINGAIIFLEGRYPTKGRVMNKLCKELAHITEGEVMLNVEGEIINLREGDQVLIEPMEKYFWDGHCKMMVFNSPAWYLDQHREISDDFMLKNKKNKKNDK